jgi:hypothetical protein
LRNDVARLDVEGIHSAGAVALIDAHAHRLRIGLVADEAYDAAQPLLSASYYLTKAVQPFADLRFDRDDVSLAVDHLLRDDAGVMILADVGALSPSTHKNLEDYVQRGGLLLRFAGPHMLAGTDDLLPVRLRRGGRVMGGALSWEQPKHIAAIDPASPLAGVKLDPDVRISRQLLAEPDAGLRAATWLALEDGTPLVSAKNIGRGLIVLVHVSADTTWSNLPLSGMFVEMLRRITEQAHDVSARSGQNDDGARAVDDSAPALAPFRSLDGFGVMGTPPLSAHAIAAHFNGPVSAEHPAGYYGGAEGVKALNALMPDDHIAGMTWAGVGVVAVPLNVPEPRDVRAWLWSAAFAFMLLDALAHLWLNGQLRGGRLAAGFIIGVGVASGVTFGDGQAYAQQNDVLAREREAALETHLAYVLTGDGRVDDISRAGLSALSRALAERTSLQPAAPLGIDVAREELSFYPLLYWPIVAGRPQPSPEAVAHLARFMRQGGTVLFDTRDALSQRAGYVTPEGEWLRRLLAGVDIPPLQIVPADHVVTKTFYLLNRFVGRTEVGETWIEALPPQNKMGSAPVRAGDNVSPIMITSNDLAAAWATNAYGAPLYQLIPNDQRQREMALRGGINVVMYTLTGNYKADQVHVHDLLERLGH